MQLKGDVFSKGFPGGWVIKNPPAVQGGWFEPQVGKIPWRKTWQLTPVFLPGKSHGQRSQVGYSPWGHKELDMMKRHSARQHGLDIALGVISNPEPFADYLFFSHLFLLVGD